MYLDLEGMQKWYLQCMEQQNVLPPQRRAGIGREASPVEESMSQEDAEEKAEEGGINQEDAEGKGPATRV